MVLVVGPAEQEVHAGVVQVDHQRREADVATLQRQLRLHLEELDQQRPGAEGQQDLEPLRAAFEELELAPGGLTD